MGWIKSHSTNRYSYEQVTPLAQEVPVMFDHVKSQIYMDIYNMRISFPTATILLGLADVKACFRYPRTQPDLTGAFSFIADKLYNLATAMVFGLTVSASSWEAFRHAIEALTKVFANRPNLVIRPKKFIDMLKWEENDPSAKLTPSFFCTINRGIIDDAGNWIDLPARMYVDNALMLAREVDHMKMVLAATIEAIFVDIGKTQCRGQAMSSCQGYVVSTGDRSKTDHVRTHHQYQQTHRRHPCQIPPRGS
jgi:hypothetical protein